MTVVGIHPEDLIDKFAAGQLSGSERAHLQAHLASCDVCRFDLQTRADLDQEAAQFWLTLKAGEQPSAWRLAPKKAPRRGVAGRLSGRQRLSIALVALVSATGALASMKAAGFPWLPAESQPRATSPSPQGEPVPRRTPVKSVEINPVDDPAVREEPKIKEAPARTLPTPKQLSSHSEVAAEAPSAARLFAEANQARRQGDTARAIQLYRQLQRDFSASAEAQLSLVTRATLELDGGNAGSALASFNRYLALGGKALEAECLFGRANALRQLGRSREERKTYSTLVSRYPASVYANQAQVRLGHLSER